MKTKYFLTSIILASMLMASCSDDIEVSGVDGNPTVAFRISMPRELGTRADGDASSHINALEWSLFEVKEDGGKRLVYTDYRMLDDLSSIQDVELSLAKGGRYKVTFCAYDSENRAFAKCEDGVISVDYSAAGINQIGDDIFVGCSEEILAEKETHEEPVILHRPFAQLNWASSDLEAVTVKPYLSGTSVGVTVFNGLHTTLDLFSGEVSGEVTETISFPLLNCQNMDNGRLAVAGDNTDYKLLAMNYLLTEPESSTISCGLNFKGRINMTIPVENTPVESNFKTNIYGSLITDPANLKIEKLSAFKSDKIVTDHPFAEIAQRILDGENVEIPEGEEVDLYGLGNFCLHDNQILTVNGTLLISSEQLKVADGVQATIDGTGTIKAKNESTPRLIGVYSGATLNLSGVSLQNNTISSDAMVYINGGTANIDSVTIEGNTFGINCQKDAVLYLSNSTIQTRFYLIDGTTYRGRPVHIQTGSQAYLSDNTIDSDLGVCLDGTGAKCVIEGGSVTTHKIDGIAYNHCFYLYEGGDIVIKGGVYTSCTASIIHNHTTGNDDITYQNVSAVVEGGQFNIKINLTDNIRLADGCEQVCEPDADGTDWYWVRPIE